MSEDQREESSPWTLHQPPEEEDGGDSRRRRGDARLAFWQRQDDPAEVTVIDPSQLHGEYYDLVRRQKRARVAERQRYHLGGYEKYRRTLSNASSCQNVVIEDFPLYAVERERLTQACLDILANETQKQGPWRGDTKTAKSIRHDGWRQGLQGLFGRILWFELLEQVRVKGDVGGLNRDSIFPSQFVGDAAVLKEFVEAGRTQQQAEQVMRAVASFMEQAARSLIEMRRRTDLKTDAALNAVKCEVRPVLSREGSFNMYHLSCSGVTLSISEEHMNKLLRLYRLHTDPHATKTDPVFWRRVFCVIQRYETLSGPSEGYQMAFPNNGFQFLRDRLGVTVECFASPLNCWNQRFCSVARDTDRFFGSLGNFFKFEGHTGRLHEDDEGLPLGGSFEANPPFVEAIMNSMAERIDYLLEKYSNVPFSVIVVVPAWADCAGVIQMTSSRFNRPHPGYRLVLEKNKHDYRPGMQHRSQHSHQPSNVDTFMFFLQNDKGAARWPYRESDGEELKEMLESTVTKRRF